MRRGCLYIRGVISNPGHTRSTTNRPQTSRILLVPAYDFFSILLPLRCPVPEPPEVTPRRGTRRRRLSSTVYEMKSVLSSLYVLPFVCNYVLVSSSILTPIRADGGLRIFKDAPSDFEYVLKRHNADDRAEDADSKERRSNMGSSFIRYGRSDPDGAMEKPFDGDGSSKVNRYPRWKSPDIVIRFGRSGFKGMNNERETKRGRNDLNFIRYGRNVQVYPVEVDMTAMCSDLLSNDEIKNLHLYETRLLRLCNILNNIDAEHRNSLDFLEERYDSKND